MMDERIKRRLVASGLMDEPTGATRRARSRSCPRCGRPVMLGLNADWAAQAVEADPQPLSAVGEAVALMAGRVTIELRWIGDRYELDRRDHFRIAGSPAGTNGLDVLVVHECDRDYGGAIPNIATSLRDISGPISAPSIDPPF